MRLLHSYGKNLYLIVSTENKLQFSFYLKKFVVLDFLPGLLVFRVITAHNKLIINSQKSHHSKMTVDTARGAPYVISLPLMVSSKQFYHRWV